MENAIHKSSCIMILFQIGLDSTRSNMLLQLYSQLIKETCFNVLRTKEQLGYIVFSGVWRQGGVHGLQFIVQSHKKPKFLDSRIENFIKETRETIKVSTKLHKSKVLIVLPRTSWSKTDNLSFDKINTYHHDFRKFSFRTYHLSY